MDTFSLQQHHTANEFLFGTATQQLNTNIRYIFFAKYAIKNNWCVTLRKVKVYYGDTWLAIIFTILTSGTCLFARCHNDTKKRKMYDHRSKEVKIISAKISLVWFSWLRNTTMSNTRLYLLLGSVLNWGAILEAPYSAEFTQA